MNIELINDILMRSVVSQKGIIGETIFVESNPATVEMFDVRKVNSKIVNIKSTKTYELKKFICKGSSQDIKECIIKSLDKYFLKSISKHKNVKFYKNRIYKLLNITNDDFIKEFIGYDWIIISEKVLKNISKIKSFTPNYDDINSQFITTIRKIGYIRNTKVYKSVYIEDNVIYAGYRDKTVGVFLKDISLFSELNIYNIGIDYLFINSQSIKLYLK